MTDIITRELYPILEPLGLVTQGNLSSFAVTSPDDAFRYLLGRIWDQEKHLLVLGMMNPSKARHDVDDHTIRKCLGFARREAAGGILVVNMAALSATNPDDMVAAHNAGINVVGEHNAAALDWALRLKYTIRIAAWGKIPEKVLPLTLASRRRFHDAGALCLGINADGSPKHPLTLSYDTAKTGLRPYAWPTKEA